MQIKLPISLSKSDFLKTFLDPLQEFVQEHCLGKIMHSGMDEPINQGEMVYGSYYRPARRSHLDEECRDATSDIDIIFLENGRAEMRLVGTKGEEEESLISGSWEETAKAFIAWIIEAAESDAIAFRAAADAIDSGVAELQELQQ